MLIAKEFVSPYLVIQILDPSKAWHVVSEENICSLGSKSLLDDFAFAETKNTVLKRRYQF